MSNTYFEIKKEVVTEPQGGYPGYKNKFELSLTAFVGKKDNLQLTIQTTSSLPNQSGVAYITLSNDDVDKLIIGLLERRMYITTTGDNQSNVSPCQ